MKAKLRDILYSHKQSIIAFGLIILAVVSANAFYVFGFRDPTPLLQLSGQVIHAEPRLIEGIDTLDPNNGFTSEALGTRSAKTILEGNAPYWNYYEGVGSPLAGEMQSAALSPFTLPLAFSGGLLFSHMLLEIVAGLFTYLLLRRLGLRFSIAVIGGVVFALNGTFAWLTNAAFNPIAFLPMLIYGIETAYSYRKEKKLNGWLWISIAIAGSLYAGFPETAFINTLLASAWALVLLFSTETMYRKRLLIRFVLGYLMGILLAAPILAAFLGYLPDANIGGHSDAFAHVGLNILSLPALVLPYIYGPLSAFSGYDTSGELSRHWGSVGGYVPISLFILALIGLFSRLNKKLKAMLLIWIVACLLKMFSVPIIEDLWNLVPTIKNAAFFRYVTPSIYFAVMILAMHGLQEVCSRSFSAKKLWAAFAMAVAGLGIVVLIAKANIGHVAGAPHFKVFAAISVLWACLILGMLFAGQVVIRKKYLTIFMSTLVVIDIFIMFVIPQLSTPKVAIDNSPVQYLQKNIGLSRYYTLGPIAPNYGSYYGIASINQNDLPVPKLWSEYLKKNLDSNTDPILFIGSFRADQKGPTAFEEFVRNQQNFRKVGVKYLVTSHQQLSEAEIKSADLSLVYQTKFVNIFQLKDTRPYFTVSEGCKITKIKNREFLSYTCDKAATVIRSELYMPGWHAYVDGKQVPIKNNDRIFQSILVPQGKHSVSFKFTPRFIIPAYLLALIALASTGIIYSGIDLDKYLNKLRYLKR